MHARTYIHTLPPPPPLHAPSPPRARSGDEHDHHHAPGHAPGHGPLLGLDMAGLNDMGLDLGLGGPHDHGDHDDEDGHGPLMGGGEGEEGEEEDEEGEEGLEGGEEDEEDEGEEEVRGRRGWGWARVVWVGGVGRVWVGACAWVVLCGVQGASGLQCGDVIQGSHGNWLNFLPPLLLCHR